MKELVNIYKEVKNHKTLAKELGKAYAEYVEMTYANPGFYHRHEEYGRKGNVYWYKIVITKD